ncbi:hypothetical protein BZG02_12915 [Labilibaculum filiforme]|uniref:Secretion system C-terminal sorting domain-containing protein n=2 Tax=Labilibaculum filiforme TaxID=1940526 RepID=A0A2N3HVX8_9BACT|nr:hypothetical protein BZG02_12915 [Labilibaculum filiforme]
MFVSTALLAKNYFVAPNGLDSNAGTLGAPFKTIQKAADVMIAGDKCYLRKGTYREKVSVKVSNVVFEAYNNEFVVVSGADVISAWTRYSGEIYKARLSNVESEFTQVFFKGKHQHIARYPDKNNDDMFSIEDGYAPLEVKTGGKVVFDTAPNGGTNYWKGGYFRAISGKTWVNPTGKIKGSTGKDLTCDMITKSWIDGYDKCVGRGVGYILHLNALSKAGEWYYQDNTLYFWKPGGGKPSDTEVEAQKREQAFFISEKNNITLKNIHIKAASIALKNSNNCVIDGCSFHYPKGWFTRPDYSASYTELGGVYVKGNNNIFRNCYFDGGWGSHLSYESGDNNEVSNCFFENNGWMGMFTSSIYNGSSNLDVNHSSFASTGRFHIRTHNATDIKHCDFYDCMKMGQDAGSIEITNGGNWGVPVDMKGSEIAYNKFHDMNTLHSYNDKKNFVVAFYLEGAENYTVHHNLIYNIQTDEKQGSFVYLGPRKSKIKKCYYYNNTVWNVDKLVNVWNRDNKGEISSSEFVNNILDSRAEIDWGNPSLESGVSFIKNQLISNPNNIFVNASQANFSLKNGSAAIDFGKNINGITDNYKGVAPDAGCFEKGNSNWTCGSSLQRPQFPDDDGSFSDDATVIEEIEFVNLASSFVQNRELTVRVAHTTSEKRDIVVILTSPNGTWLGNKKISAEAGANETDLTIAFDDQLELGNNYKLEAMIRLSGGAYTDNILVKTAFIDINSERANSLSSKQNSFVYPTILNEGESDFVSDSDETKTSLSLDSSTGVSLMDQNVRVSPNPFVNSFKINFGGADVNFIKLYDTKGQLVYSQPVQSNTSDIEVFVENNCAPGLYLLQVGNNKSVQTVKLLKK